VIFRISLTGSKDFKDLSKYFIERGFSKSHNIKQLII